MADEGRQKDAMDVLQAWVDDYNGRAQPTIRLGSAGEAGGAQLRLKYSPAEGQVAILHMVAVNRDHVENRRSEEHTSELQSLTNLVCRLLLEKKKRRPAGVKHFAKTLAIRVVKRYDMWSAES